MNTTTDTSKPSDKIADAPQPAQPAKKPIAYRKLLPWLIVAVVVVSAVKFSPTRVAADYAGLYRSAIAMEKPTVAQLDAIKELPEVAKTSSLVEAMVAIDILF